MRRMAAPRAELHCLPGIVWIPSGLRSREDLTVPLAEMGRRGIRTHLGRRLERFGSDKPITAGRRVQYRPDPLHATTVV